LKDAELHGHAAVKHGGSELRKKDPALMANGVDWKNSGA
jgi:hypothetical protein